MRHSHLIRFQRVMPKYIADRLPWSPRPTRHLLTPTLSEVPIAGSE